MFWILKLIAVFLWIMLAVLLCTDAENMTDIKEELRRDFTLTWSSGASDSVEPKTNTCGNLQIFLLVFYFSVYFNNNVNMFPPQFFFRLSLLLFKFCNQLVNLGKQTCHFRFQSRGLRALLVWQENKLYNAFCGHFLTNIK